MKKNGKFFMMGIILFLLIPIFGFSVDQYEERDLLIGVLEETGATFLEGDISLGGTILDRFIGYEEIKDIGNNLRNNLEIKGNLIESGSLYEGVEGDYYWEEIVEEEGFLQLMIQGLDSYNNIVTITLSSYEDVDLGPGETTLFINLINKEQFVEINDIIVKVEKIFDEYGKPVNITTCVIGTFDGYMDLRENEKRILGVARAIKGKIVEEYKEDGVLSLSIFTPYIEEYVFTGNKKMNMNIAVRFNEYEDRTYIWIGTPIITVGY
ncbi:exported hypothetical protein [[Clostridium] ultunense Esp]|uniref:TATA-box binding protein n=1 Tax=[Clostridium] ultunense Esp TaxID=1288971 RepID=M1ZK20_9FIRM|nr:YwmB family TATA-box binding protein [Schnuerera ultunensis]CCQ94687.1 exported hypothetical protein [[Clostridium] ultunense Esp]SHD76609.1 conserved protein of unknown function [[Clostridium] ultunense Esp]